MESPLGARGYLISFFRIQSYTLPDSYELDGPRGLTKWSASGAMTHFWWNTSGGAQVSGPCTRIMSTTTRGGVGARRLIFNGTIGTGTTFLAKVARRRLSGRWCFIDVWGILARRGPIRWCSCSPLLNHLTDSAVSLPRGISAKFASFEPYSVLEYNSRTLYL